MSIEYNFETEMIIPDKLINVFSFFSAAENLQLITPPWLNFIILTPTPFEIYQGRIIDYKLSLYGFHFRWRTRITHWDPPYRFIDEQTRGPYRKWTHAHYFEARGNQTYMRDHVIYKIPFFPKIADKLFVREKIELIFDYRRKKINEIFNRPF